MRPVTALSKLKGVVILVTFCGLFAVPAYAQGISVINDTPILDLLGSVEGPDGYDDIYRKTPIMPPKPLSEMTVAEVSRFQDLMVKRGSKSSAVGRYQFIRVTLGELIQTHRIDVNHKFNKRMQDYLARMLLIDCGFYSPGKSNTKIGNCLARRWAALPVLSGKKAGASYYHGIAGNRALVTMGKVRKTIARRLEQPKIPVRLATSIEWPDDGRNADQIPLSGQ